jgi:futalosine hydrolase
MFRGSSEMAEHPVVVLVCATMQEAEPFFKAFGKPHPHRETYNEGWLLQSFRYKGWELMLNVCGIGGVNTGLHLGRSLTDTRCGIEPMIQFGIAGAYDPALPLAQDVYEVVEDCYADLGAHTPDGFQDLEQLGFVNFEYYDAWLPQNRAEPERIDLGNGSFRTVYPERGFTPFFNRIANPCPSPLSIPKVKAATVQAVSGDDASIRQVRAYAPDAVLESMEGAAFFQVGLCFSGRKFYQFRAISNHVEPRNPARWRIQPAIGCVGEFVVELLRQQPDWLNYHSKGYFADLP